MTEELAAPVGVVVEDHPCKVEEGGFDHDWKLEDESFDHEFGTEQVYFWRCTRWEETKDALDSDFQHEDE